MANGKTSMWREYSTYRFYHYFADRNAEDKVIVEKLKNEILNTEIRECIIYRDSAAAVIYTSNMDSVYFIRYLSKENGGVLYELFTDEYVDEIRRRTKISGIDENQIWYDVPIEDLTKRIILESMKKHSLKRKVWPIRLD